MNTQKLSTLLYSSSFLPVACKNTVWGAAYLSSHVFPTNKEDGDGGRADTRSMNTPPIENPQHIKKDISVGGGNDNDNDNDKEKETYSDDDDSNDDGGLDTVDEEASTLLKDQSGAQDQSSS